MEDLTGKQFGSYQIISPFGEGGMATVYKAYQPSMDRFVALKVLPRFHSSDPEFLGRFEQEAKALAQLQHLHILSVYDYGEAEGYTYFVMPLMQDGNLTELLSREQLTLERVNQIISQVGSALEYAHTRGFIHRDVKPSNILLDESGNCMLMDFGIAKIIEGSKEFTRTGGVLGTPAYMSPEQGSGRKKIDHKSDIYSLGIILYEMVTGRPPYEAETPIAIIFKHVHDPLPPPSSIKTDVPEDVERVILKSLAKDPNDRYETVREMMDALSMAVNRITLRVEPEPDPYSTMLEVTPEPPSEVSDLTIPEPEIEESPVEVSPPVVESDEVQKVPLSENRLFRPALIAVGAIALILLGIWLTNSDIFSSGEVSHADETESAVISSTDIPGPTNTSAVVFAPATAPATDTPRAPDSTNTPVPPTESPYAVVPTPEGPGIGFQVVRFLGFDGVTPPFDDPRIRLAIASSIDKVGLANNMSANYPEFEFIPATNFTPRDVIGFDLYGEVGHPYDPGYAQELMAEAGYPNGEGFPGITLYHWDSESQRDLATQIRADLSEVLGITIYTSPLQFVYSDPPAFFLIGWGGDYIDPHSYLYDAFCGNYNTDFLESDDYWSIIDGINGERDARVRSELIMEYSNTFCYGEWDPDIDLGSEYKRLLDRALETDNFDEARMLYVEAEAILVESNTLIVPLYHRAN
jgi:serine/threonine protein kinase